MCGVINHGGTVNVEGDNRPEIDPSLINSLGSRRGPRRQRRCEMEAVAERGEGNKRFRLGNGAVMREGGRVMSCSGVGNVAEGNGGRSENLERRPSLGRLSPSPTPSPCMTSPWAPLPLHDITLDRFIIRAF